MLWQRQNFVASEPVIRFRNKASIGNGYMHHLCFQVNLVAMVTIIFQILAYLHKFDIFLMCWYLSLCVKPNTFVSLVCQIKHECIACTAFFSKNSAKIESASIFITIKKFSNLKESNNYWFIMIQQGHDLYVSRVVTMATNFEIWT